MKSITTLLITTLVLTGTVLIATAAIAQNVSDSNIEILKQKIKADKKLLISQNMDLTDTEAEQFWPLYDSFQKDLAGVNQRMANTVKDYAGTINKGPIPNDTAKKLVNEDEAFVCRQAQPGAAPDEGHTLHPDGNQDPVTTEKGVGRTDSACLLIGVL
jgi:hypothetical protein